jgi:hypothetical protein
VLLGAADRAKAARGRVKGVKARDSDPPAGRATAPPGNRLARAIPYTRAAARIAAFSS